MGQLVRVGTLAIGAFGASGLTHGYSDSFPRTAAISSVSTGG